MIFRVQAQSRPALCCLVIPVDGPFRYQRLADGARHLLDASYHQVHEWIGGPPEILAVNTKTQHLWRCNNGLPFPLARLTVGGTYVLMNIGFLLSDTPPIAALIQQAGERGVVWCGARSSRDTHAVAFTSGEPASSLTSCQLWQALTHLTACLDDDVEDAWRDIAQRHFIAPSHSSVENSPAMRQLPDVWCRRRGDAPRFLNTAFKEIISKPQSWAAIGGDPGRMAEALVAQRNASCVPWIFNTWLNDIDYRVGALKPRSFPPEIHLSITGRCNIECRFCAYTHDMARSQFVEPAHIARMKFLPNVQTLRLQTGLGEPTLNRHLPAIIDYVSTHYPHIGMNFFTNALALHRPGLIDAIVGDVRWLNVSLNAATRESWEQQCKIDQFERVCSNLRELHRVKQARRSLWPLVFGSMVLNRANVQDLPRMPGLCRELGVDRFTAFPHFALGYSGEKYGADMTLAACREEYDVLYDETVRQAESHNVSLEIPLPSHQTRSTFGLEVRSFYDFARIESNEWSLGRFLTGVKFNQPVGAHCHFLWQQGSIGSTHNASHAQDETHYMHPCIGPLSIVDFSRKTAFRFPDAKGFLDLWQGPTFSHLRQAQHGRGVCEVCDFCRQHDTRDPQGFAQLESLVAQFSAQNSGRVEASQAQETNPLALET